MRKTLLKAKALLLVVALLATLAACGENNTTSSTGLTSQSVSVSESERKFYKPTSLTVSLYDAENLCYGFTWNTEYKPIESVVQICEGTKFSEENCAEYGAETSMQTVYMPNPTLIYVAKTQCELKPNTTYTYRAYDKGAETGTDLATFTTIDHSAKSFTFVHASDSQVTGLDSDITYSGDGTGVQFGKALEEIVKIKPAFLVHTGDIVEWSKYETYWKNMLDFNGSYLRELPFMAISGNHETTYRAGENEVFKHFNIKIPEQTTEKGFFYCFDVGDARFIMLNTNKLTENGIDFAQKTWLEEALNTNKKWKIVAMHHPLYSVGKWGSDPEQNETSLLLRSQLSSVFAENGVDLVLQGHDHTYSKTYPINKGGVAVKNSTFRTENSVKYIVNPKGTIYAMHGAAGTQTRSPVNIDESIFEIAAASKPGSFAEIKVEKDRLTVHIKYAEDGKTVNYTSYGIIKE